MDWKTKIRTLSQKKSTIVHPDVSYGTFKNYITKYKKETGKKMWFREVDKDVYVVTRWLDSI